MSHSSFLIGRPDEIRAGVIVASDMALDAELWRWAPDGVNLMFTRTPYTSLQVTVEKAELVGDEGVVEQCTRSLQAATPKAYALASASGSFVGGLKGEQRLVETMRSVGGAGAVTTSGAMLSALTHLGVQRVATATPYDDHVADRWSSFLDEAGIEVVSSTHLGLTSEIRSVPYEATMQLVRDADSPDAEAVVVACTNLATYDVIAPLEAELGKPVVTANQATMWTLLEAIGRRAVGPHQWLITGPTVGGPLQRRRGFDG